MKKNIARCTKVEAVLFFLGIVFQATLMAEHEEKYSSDHSTVVTQTLPVSSDHRSVSEFDVNIDEASFSEDQVHAQQLKAIEDTLIPPGSASFSSESLPSIMHATSTGTAFIEHMTQIAAQTNNAVTAMVETAEQLKKTEAARAQAPDTKSSESKPAPAAKIQMDDVAITKEESKNLNSITKDTSIVSEKKHSIILNATMPLTGSMALVGRDYLTGINLVFDKFNRAGGLAKKYLIKYVAADDRYLSTIAKENIMKSAKESPFFIGNFGSHALATIQDLIINKEVLMLFPTVGDATFRKKEYRNLINFRPSMDNELKALVKYAINDQHRKKIAIFYEENQWGKSGLAAVEKILQEFSLTPCARASYPANTIAVMPAASEIIKSRPDAIVCISTYRPTYNFIQLVLNEGFQHCLFLGLGPSTPMQQLLKKSRGVTIATTSVVPDPVKSKLPIVEAYRKDMTKYFPLREMSQYSLEGYLVGSIFISALKQLEAPYSVDKLLEFFEDLSFKDFGGFKINFNPDTRELSSRIWINKGAQDAEWDASFSE